MDQFKKLFASLPVRQLWTIVICTIAIGVGVVAFSRWQRENGMRPLYTSLSPEDASSMVQKLREGGVDYRISENGTTLLVAEDKVPELRLEMAGLGLPKTGRIGFEIFDKTNFGITDFAERVNYRRAVEGELERSIMAIAEVQQARVHVSLPKESVFTDSQEPAKASVLVGLRPGSGLSQQNVIAITNLVSSAVEGLSPESIAVVDMRGNLLSRPHRDGLADGSQSTEASLDYRQAIEHDLVVKINNTLEPLLGVDKFRTGVSADVDMTSGEQSEETFDPAKTVMLSSQKTEDTTSNNRTTASSPPGLAANLPPTTIAASSNPTAQQAASQQPAAPQTTPPTGQPPTTPAAQQAAARPAGNSTSSVKRTESITYQSSRMTKHIKLAQGAVKRLSIAVLVDQGSKWEGQGNQLHRVVTPPDPEKLKAIQSLVSTLVGLDTVRGDQLTVEALPFDNTLSSDLTSPGSPALPKKSDQTLSLETLKQKPALLWGSVGGVVVVVALVVFAMTRGKKGKVNFEPREVLPIPVTTDTAAISAAAAAGHIPGSLPALMPSRTETLLTQLQESGKNNPEAWAGVLRGWLSEEEAN